MRNKKGQIWVETVLYTLIGLALIGVVLALATPKINAARDRSVVEQSIEALNVFDEKIRELKFAVPGNVRKIDLFTFRRGEFTVDAENDKIVFFIEGLEEPYSEPGIVSKNGRVEILSEEGRKKSTVSLTLDYDGSVDITYNGVDELKKFVATATPYSFSVENKGDAGGLTVIDVKETSRG